MLGTRVGGTQDAGLPWEADTRFSYTNYSQLRSAFPCLCPQGSTPHGRLVFVLYVLYMSFHVPSGSPRPQSIWPTEAAKASRSHRASSHSGLLSHRLSAGDYVSKG